MPMPGPSMMGPPMNPEERMKIENTMKMFGIQADRSTGTLTYITPTQEFLSLLTSYNTQNASQLSLDQVQRGFLYLFGCLSMLPKNVVSSVIFPTDPNFPWRNFFDWVYFNKKPLPKPTTAPAPPPSDVTEADIKSARNIFIESAYGPTSGPAYGPMSGSDTPMSPTWGSTAGSYGSGDQRYSGNTLISDPASKWEKPIAILNYDSPCTSQGREFQMGINPAEWIRKDSIPCYSCSIP
jgi:hypothetical protein